MKEDQKKWWSSWAPYWEYLEDRHLSLYETDRILNNLAEPILVVGAGQGLVVEHLKKKGLRTDGIDLSREMVHLAQRRRSLLVILGDARSLPLKANTYNTVILATGVLDYISENGIVVDIIKECQRVLGKNGNLFASFYRLAPNVENIYRNLGVLTDENWYRIKRIFTLFKTMDKSPFACIKLVRDWTGRSYFWAFYYWTRLGLTLPRELKSEQQTVEEIVAAAQRNGVAKSELFDCTPDFIPYRKEAEIEAILAETGITDYELMTSEECVTVKCNGEELA